MAMTTRSMFLHHDPRPVDSRDIPQTRLTSVRAGGRDRIVRGTMWSTKKSPLQIKDAVLAGKGYQGVMVDGSNCESNSDHTTGRHPTRGALCRIWGMTR